MNASGRITELYKHPVYTSDGLLDCLVDICFSIYALMQPSTVSNTSDIIIINKLI